MNHSATRNRSDAGNYPNRAARRSTVLNSFEKVLKKYLRATFRRSTKRALEAELQAHFDKAIDDVKPATVIRRARLFDQAATPGPAK